MEQIKPKDLRIGNIFNPDTPTKVEGWMFVSNPAIVFKPIPLTEEWLINLGFISNPYEDRYELDGFYIECNKTRGYLELWESRTALNLTTVHQLQNAFFAITGKELELSNHPVTNKE